jgi:endonuclease YncB( thermonuclease family)
MVYIGRARLLAYSAEAAASAAKAGPSRRAPEQGVHVFVLASVLTGLVALEGLVVTAFPRSVKRVVGELSQGGLRVAGVIELAVAAALTAYLLAASGKGAAHSEGAEPRPDSLSERDDLVHCLLAEVVDGETIVAHDMATKEDLRVGLVGVDAPAPGAPGGEEAKAALRRMLEETCPGCPVMLALEFERAGERSRDGEGRLLAYVLAGKDVNMNVEMVRAGWARRTPSGGRYAAAFREAEEEARAARRGLWAGGEGSP